MITIGLTGSIGMGKSTTAGLFAEEGVPVWDADAAVHRLYRPEGEGTREIATLCPRAVGADGVDRSRLREAIRSDPGLLEQVEARIHPLVARDRTRFLDRARKEGAPVAVCDIPLLFETGSAGQFDHVVVVSTDPETQRERVLSRPGMTEESLASILARQVPDAEKRRQADTVIETGLGIEAARRAVRDLLQTLR